MERRFYTAPEIQIIEISGCNVICSSIPIVDEETNTGGRAKKHDCNNWGDLWK